MKKIIYVCLMFLILTGCSFEKLKQEDVLEPQTSEKEEVVEEEEVEEEKYVDSNPLKIALYQKGNGFYQKQTIFKSKLGSFKDIGLFSIILDDKDKVEGSSVKSLYNTYQQNYDNLAKYKIGYQISFTLDDGTNFKETVLKPLGVYKYSFSDYLYIWLYDDINNSGSYSHLEPEDFKDNTVMSSIKLMSTSLSKKINSQISVMVFTYDTEDDFDLDGYYRGNSKYEMFIEREA